jgi:hypothetical protein
VQITVKYGNAASIQFPFITGAPRPARRGCCAADELAVPFFHTSLHENKDDFQDITRYFSARSHESPTTMSTRRNRLLNRVLALALPALFGCCVTGQAGTFNVRDYGAQGDGRALDSPAIQKTIDACAKAGGGTVRLAPGTYLSRPFSKARRNSPITVLPTAKSPA